jgi:multiple sugar transport system substrate-binding protein
MQQNVERSGFAYQKSSRRAFLQWTALATFGTALAACTPKVVKETVIVEKEKQVTTVVEKEKEVTKIVEKEKVVEKAVEKVVTATPAPAGPITIRFPHAMGDEGQPVFQAIADKFKEKHSNVTVKVEPTFDWDAQKYIVQAAAGTAPDIIWADEHFVYEFCPKGMLLEMDPFLDKSNFKKDSFVDLFPYYTYTGKLYGVALWYGCYLMFYNKKLLQEAGVAEPTPDWTYDDLLIMLKALTKTDKQPETWGMRAQKHWNRWGSLIWAFGGDFFNEDGTKFVLCDKPNYAGLQWYVDLIVKHKVAPSPELDSALAGGGDPFVLGSVAMAPGSAYSMVTFRKIKEFEWDVCLNPKGPNGSHSVLTTDSLSIYRGSQNPEVVWEFIESCLTEDAAKVYCNEFKGPIPALKSGQKYFLLPNDPPAHQQYFIDAQENGKPPMQSPYSAPVTLPFNSALDPVFNGTKTLEDMLAEVCPVIAQDLADEIERVKSYTG